MNEAQDPPLPSSSRRTSYPVSLAARAMPGKTRLFFGGQLRL